MEPVGVRPTRTARTGLTGHVVSRQHTACLPANRAGRKAKEAFRVHDELVDAFSPYQEGSSERMQLALEYLRALRTDVQQTPPAQVPEQHRWVQPPPWESSIPLERSLHPDIERIARKVMRRAYGAGMCFVSWTKLARLLKMEEAVLRGHLAEMEREELIRITPRDEKPPLIQFADGTWDALRYKRIYRITTQERTHPRVERTFANRVLRYGDD